MNKLLIIFSFLFLVSCQSVNNFSKEFNNLLIGKDINEYIFKVGPPDSKTTLSDGRQIFVYKEEFLYQGVTYNCLGNFFVNDKNEIVRIDFVGLRGPCIRLINRIKIN